MKNTLKKTVSAVRNIFLSKKARLEKRYLELYAEVERLNNSWTPNWKKQAGYEYFPFFTFDSSTKTFIPCGKILRFYCEGLLLFLQVPATLFLLDFFPVCSSRLSFFCRD